MRNPWPEGCAVSTARRPESAKCSKDNSRWINERARSLNKLVVLPFLCLPLLIIILLLATQKVKRGNAPTSACKASLNMHRILSVCNESREGE